MDCVVKIIPMVCMYAGHSDLLAEVEAGVRVTQKNDQAVAFAQAAALMLEACILKCVPTFREILVLLAQEAKETGLCPFSKSSVSSNSTRQLWHFSLFFYPA